MIFNLVSPASSAKCSDDLRKRVAWVASLFLNERSSSGERSGETQSTRAAVMRDPGTGSFDKL